MYPAVNHLRFTSSIRNISLKTARFRAKDWKQLCLLMCSEGFRSGFYRMHQGGKKKSEGWKWGTLQLTHDRQCLLVVHVYLITPLAAFFTLMVAVSQGEYNSPWVVMDFICIIQEMLCLCGLLLSCTIPRWAFFWTITRGAFLYISPDYICSNQAP